MCLVNNLVASEFGMRSVMAKGNNYMSMLRDLVDILAPSQSGSVGHSLSDVLAPPQSGSVVRSLVGYVGMSWPHLRVDWWEIYPVMSWPHLRVDWWNVQDLTRGRRPSYESSHRYIYDDPTSNSLE